MVFLSLCVPFNAPRGSISEGPNQPECLSAGEMVDNLHGDSHGKIFKAMKPLGDGQNKDLCTPAELKMNE